MKKVLITGARGFVGRHCIPILLKKGYQVHAITSKGDLPASDAEGLFWHSVDLLAHGEIDHIVSKVGPTHLLHFAWYTEHGLFWHSERNMEWVIASLRLLQAFAGNNGQRAVFVGTCAEYDWRYGYCNERLTPLEPSTLYGVSKNALQKMFHQYSRQKEISQAWGRIFFLYGPFEHENRLIPYVIKSLINDIPAECTDGHQVRDFLHVEDVADAFAALLDSDIQGPVNIASGEPVSIRHIVEKTGALIGKPGLIRLGARSSPVDEPQLILADTNRLKREMHWNPKHDLKTGLASTIHWFREMNP